MINVSADNLGANGIFGFVESFAATFHCRICELSSAECKTEVEEVLEKLSRKSTYAAHVNSLESSVSKNPDYKLLKGVKKYCTLTAVKSQHLIILNNVTGFFSIISAHFFVNAESSVLLNISLKSSFTYENIIEKLLIRSQHSSAKELKHLPIRDTIGISENIQRKYRDLFH